MAVAGPRFPLPARDRILIHLSDFPAPTGDEGGFPAALTQDGIAARTGLGRAHVALALKSLREEMLVEELKGRVAGEARRRKVYALSASGRELSKRILAVIMDQEISVVSGDRARKARLSEASFILQRKVPLVELALAVDEGAILNLAPDGRPVQVLEEDAGALEGGDEEEESAPGAPTAPEPRAPPAFPETLYQEYPEAQPVPVEQPPGPPAAPSHATAGAKASGPELSPWVKRGQLAAVWIAALVLSVMFIWLGNDLDEAVEPDFLVMYFLVMVSLQAVLLGVKGIPANVRAELGVFLGAFLALYGGFLLLGPPFPSLLWFTEGMLLLSTGLLLASLDNDRKFQTIGAGAGAFIIIVCRQWLPVDGGPMLTLFLVLWMLVGALLLAARLFPGRISYTAHLKIAAGLAAATFLLTIGAFLALRGLFAESFVELLVGLVIIYYIAPRKRESWSWVLVTCTVIMCVMVALTTIIALFAFLPRLSSFIG
jgi:DNA-binding MarR family transcriptional regulator